MNPREITDTKLLQDLLIESINEKEALSIQVTELQETVKELQDMFKKLQGGQGRPKFPGRRSKGKVPKIPRKETRSSKPETKEAASSDDQIPVDRVEIVDSTPDTLPADAVFKGYRSVYQQDVRICRDHVEFKVARWYSPCEGRYYESPLPAEYQGRTGGMLRSLIQMLHHCGDVTHRKIAELMDHFGVSLSLGTISNILTKSDWAEQEQKDLLSASIGNSPYVQMDSTTSRQQGKRMHTQVMCGRYFSLFYTQKGKSRLDVYAALQGCSRRTVRLAYTPHAAILMDEASVSKKHIEYLAKVLPEGESVSMQTLEGHFNTEAIFANTNESRRSVIAGALAAGYYVLQHDIPRVQHLLTDEGREYKKVAQNKHIYCWVHAIRHFRVMTPKDDYLASVYEGFMNNLWNFYQRIKTYRDEPPAKQAIQKASILAEFDRVFNPSTDYHTLNDQIALMQEKRTQLLVFLEHPTFPIHNNAAERGARRIVRKRDISLHTWSERGTRVRDAFMSLQQTAKKLNVPFLDYLLDRNTRSYLMKSLASHVEQKYRGFASTC